MVGLSDDSGNVSRLFKRTDVQARVRYVNGELDDETPPDLTSLSGVMVAMASLAKDATTSDSTRVRALEFLAQASAENAYAPKVDELFDPRRLSAAQLAVCERYYQHVSAERGSDAARTLIEKLAAMSQRSGSPG